MPIQYYYLDVTLEYGCTVPPLTLKKAQNQIQNVAEKRIANYKYTSKPT